MNYLTNPEIFQINRLEAHSDHKYYGTKEEMASKQMTYRESLNGTWKFCYSKNLDQRPLDFYKENFDYSSWDTIKVPGHIQLQGFDKPHYVNTMYPWDGHEYILPPELPKDFNPVGSYIREFSIPGDWDLSRVFISFQGVESAFNLWINGEFVGYSEDTFTPSEFEISKYLISGKNKIAVEVIKWCSGSWLEDQDFWRLSGIFRDVFLFSYPEVHVNDFFLKTDLDDNFKNSSLHLDIKLKNSTKDRAKLYFELYDMKDNLVKKSNEIETENEFCNLNTFVENISLWSAEKPNLYTLYLYVHNGAGTLVEVIPYKVGFRKFEMKNKVMHLNGKRIVFKGVNRHEFNCYNGRYVSEEDMLWDINFLKQNNLNSVRTSHYPNNSRWYELCDEYGIYLIDETNLESHGSWQKMGACKPDWVIPGDKKEWLNVVLDRAKSMLERDKNHASILIWSCGNEAYGGENIFKMSEYFRDRDPSRLVHYEGIWWDRRFNDTSDMESRMYAKVKDIEEYLDDNPSKPFISCEYTHSMGNSNGNLYKYTELEDKYEMYQGGFIWDYIDQGIMKKDRYGKEFLAYGGDFDDRPTDYNFCFNGIVYSDRKPSQKVQEVKALFSNFKLYPNKKELTIKNESLFTDCNEFELKYSLKFNGEIINSITLEESVPPLSKKTIELTLPHSEIPGEYTIEASLHLKEDTKWAEKGHELCFGQYVYTLEATKNVESSGTLIVENSDVNLGVKGENFHFIFSKAFGRPVSIKYHGKEFINLPPMPNFWRAMTDNDRGNKMANRYAQWKIASLYALPIDMAVENSDNKLTITYTYDNNTNPKTFVKVKYTVYPSGKINVFTSYNGNSEISDMPLFGITMKIPADYNMIKWYGNGPFESYIDRKEGAKLGVYQNSITENLSEYSVPQEYGNKTDVRWFEIFDNKNIGLKFSSKTPFEFSALPYTAHELESAMHKYELPEVHYTVLNINKIQMGVGGDDSWGAPTHDEFLVKASEVLEFDFDIEFNK